MMRKYALPMALLFIAFTAPTIAQTGAAATERAPEPAAAPARGDLLYYNLLKPLRLNCTAGASAYTWTKNGTALEVGKDAAGPRLEEGGAVLAWERAREDDYGQYTCSADGAPGGAWDVHARAVLRLPADSNVVEGQNVTLTCKPHGRPLQPVTWYYAPLGVELLHLDNLTAVLAQATPVPADVAGSRFATNDTEAGLPRGQLRLWAAEAGDAGQYLCVPEEGSAGVTALRVKDVYAALWPFLGICAEVFVLCAVILLYEKRRTKPELDDSDADAHDQ